MSSLAPYTHPHWSTSRPPEAEMVPSLTEASVAVRRALVGLGTDEEYILRNVHEHVAEAPERLLNRLASRAQARLTGPDGDKLWVVPRARLIAYVDGLLLGPHDLSYAMERVRVGIAHQQGGVEPHHYLAGNLELSAALADVALPLLSSSDPTPKDVVSAIAKVLAFDASIILETHVHAQRRQCEFLTTHDSLTLLPNGNGVWHHLDKSISSTSPLARLAILLIGLSRFRTINETLGHRIGDKLLRVIARRLESQNCTECFVGRMSGDQFVIVQKLGKERPDAVAIARQVLSRLERPFELDGFTISVDANIGVACYPEHGQDPETLLKNAETALDTGKALQNALTLFSAEYRHSSADDFQLMGQLRDAIDGGELMLHYQPKVEADGYRFAGAEALLRWNHPQRGMVPPGMFIPLAEQTTIIHPITDWLIREACQQLADWQTRGMHVSVALNLAAANLQNRTLPDVVRDALRKWSIEPAQLVCEITESGFLRHPDTAFEILRDLRALGVTLSLDDFGTGYSSLAYLRDLPVQEIKLDRSFISRLRQSGRDEQIVAHVIQLAHGLGLTVVAEGVEDRGTAEHLAAIGCDRLQGFFFARPLPAADLTVLLMASASNDGKGRDFPWSTPSSETRLIREGQRADQPVPAQGPRPSAGPRKE